MIYGSAFTSVPGEKARFEIKWRTADLEDLVTMRHLCVREQGKGFGENPPAEKRMVLIAKIRAIQGHSVLGIDNVLTLGRRKLADMPESGNDSRPPVLAHGASRYALASIMQQGLKASGKKRNRNDNHFTPIVDLKQLAETGKKEVPGFRAGCDIVLFVSTSLALEAGCELVISPGGAVLCPEPVPRHCIIAAVTCPGGRVIANGPALPHTTEHERTLCGLPERFKEKLPIGDEPPEVKARGSKDSRPPP